MTRQERAAYLAGRHPEAREALEFYAAIAEFQGDWRELRDLVLRAGPAMLRESARELTPERIESEPYSLFARVLRRQNPPSVRHAETSRCPRCGEPPQAGVLRPEAHTAALTLLCSCCGEEWPHARGLCPVCGERDRDQLSWFTAEDLPHVHTQVCETCARYLHVIHLGEDPRAVPEVDEVAAIAMDVWAREQGWEKICPNLIGI